MVSRRSKWPAWLAGLTLALLTGLAPAEERIRTFQLEHRSGEEIKALLAPMAGEGVALTATGFKLIARGPSAELDRLAALVRELDTAAPDIVIETRRSSGRSQQGRGVGTTGDADAKDRVKVYSSRDARATSRIQRARGQAGRPVFISRALELPVRDRSVLIGDEQTGIRERTHYRPYQRGFYATAHVSGQRVRVEISTADDTPGESGSAERRRVVTTVTGKLGEWLLIGATETERRQRGRGLTYSTRDAADEHEQLWLRVRLAR